MKSKVLGMLAAILFCGTLNVQAQYYDHKHEVGISIGGGANTQIIGGLADIMEVAVDEMVSRAITAGQVGGHYSYSDKSEFPALSVEYYYRLSKVVGIGGFLAYNDLKRDMYIDYQDAQGKKTRSDKVGVAKRSNFSIIPAVKIDYLRKKNFGMYTKFGFGLSMMYEKQKDDEVGEVYSHTDYNVNFQASLLGIEAGSPKLRGFLELGVGEQGLALIGARYKF
ncbi:MAG: hypothetical protein IKX24_12415 [Prevotella sp.]|nr:hypothetical protein [Prevotella sp.]